MVSLIVVDYKTIPKTLEYIRDCYQMIENSSCLHAIIVDNSEESAIGLHILRKECGNEPEKISVKANKENGIERIDTMEVYRTIITGKPLIYICAKQNLGYAKGNNLGAKIAKECYGDDYYLFSNNDIRFLNKFNIEKLIAPMRRNNKIAVVGPEIIGLDGKQQSPRKIKSAWNQLFLNYYDLLLPKKLKFTDKITDVEFTDHSKECYWVTGSFMIVEAKKFQEIKGFDENTFLYCEEVILAERLRKQAYHMYYENSVKVLHEHGQTVKNAYSVLRGIELSFQSSLYYYTNYRKLNRIVIRFARLNYAVFAKLFAFKKKLGKAISIPQ